MQTYICKFRECGHIGQFPPAKIFLIACPKCTKVGQWQVYSGPMASTILAVEDKKAIALKPMVEAAKLALDGCKALFATATAERTQLEQRLGRAKKLTEDEFVVLTAAVQKSTEALAAANAAVTEAQAAYDKLNDAYTDLGNRDAVHRDAPKAFQSANQVQRTSGENKLYIGNRQYVSNHARFGKKKARILNVPNWSPGLNVSWVEGGIAAKARFKLKLNQGEQYSNIPNTLLQRFKEVPSMAPADFYRLCRSEGSGSLLWYDRDGAARPTWTALEIWCLLRSGYSFTFADSKKDGPGRKIVLMPPL